MEKSRIARILYNMSLDMNYADYVEFTEHDITCITNELQMLKENGCNCLLQILENITMQNEDMEMEI